MTNSYDRSYKDKKYFIDGQIYNCPFCNRRQIKYEIIERGSYDSSNEKIVYYYVVRCNDCHKKSIHHSKYNLSLFLHCHFDFPVKQIIIGPLEIAGKCYNDVKKFTEIVNNDGNVIKELDDAFYYHDPSGSFTIDKRTPSSIREPLKESESSLKYNLLTGASGCLRKAIYKLLQYENIPEKNEEKEKFFTHEERVNLLKDKYPKIDAELFNQLKVIHTLTSQELHKNDWEDFDSPILRYLIEIIKNVLYKIYIDPLEEKKQREELLNLQKKSQTKNRQIFEPI